ncbi:hypothetical protein [Sorangium sp. So ce1099]|uniref:hypothetical protein n=1 Tax=Sorangium sp. So ce1099 TaxID=3133331 RepID=UPI003F5F1FD6
MMRQATIRRTLFSIAIMLVLPVAACQASPPAALAPQVHADPGGAAALPSEEDGVLNASEANKILPASGKVVVKLLDAGAPPRSDLRYAPTKGQRQKLQVALDLARSMKKAGRSLPDARFPTLIAQIELEPTEQDQEGDWTVNSRLLKLTVESKNGHEQIAAQVAPSMEALAGQTLVYRVSSKGFVRDVKLSALEGAEPQQRKVLEDMSELLTSMIIRLPDEGVGVGAIWRVLSRTASSGADLLQSATYTLKSRDGDTLAVEVAIEELFASEVIHTPAMPQDYSVLVKRYESTAKGASELDLETLAPRSGSMVHKTSHTLNEQGEGAEPGDELSVETETDVRVSKL